MTLIQTNPQFGEIIKVNGIIGEVVGDMKNIKHFWDRKSRAFYSELPLIEEYEETTHEEKVQFLIQHFSWGEVLDTHVFGEFLVFEYMQKNENKRSFHVFRDYRSRQMSFESIYHAAIGAIAEKYDGVNTRADGFFARAIDMDREIEVPETVELAYYEIIKVNGVLGVVIKGENGKKHFWDKNTSTYYTSSLPEITEYEKTTHEEKVEFLIQNFTWGKVLKTHQFAEYLIFEYVDDKGRISFHPYENYDDMSRGYETLYHAIAGVIAIKFDGINTNMDRYFAKAIGMNEK